MNFSINSSEVQYAPLQTTEQSPPQQPTTEATTKPQPTSDELFTMQRAARGVIILGFAQLILSVFYAISEHGILLPTVTALFAVLGICGAARKNFRLLITHFVYSLLLYVLSLVGLIMFIIYCFGCSWWFFAAGFLFILLQAIGMRHSRILIGLLRKYNGCQGSSWCSRSCQRACSRTNSEKTPSITTQIATQTPILSSTETSTQTQVPAVQVPQFVLPPLPQQIDYNQSQQFPMYSYAPQGYYLRYPVMPQPPTMSPNEINYPTLPQMYRQV